MAAPRILAFSGSTRRESFNQRLVKVAANAARAAGADVTVADLGEYPMPLFDEDIERESGTPDAAVAFKTLLVEHDGILLSSPEYNSSISGVLKNAIDWASRPAEGEPPLVAFRGKTVALMAASPGGLGGLRGLVHVRDILGNIGMIVLPDQFALSKAHEAFDDDGAVRDAGSQKRIAAIAQSLVDVTRKLSID